VGRSKGKSLPLLGKRIAPGFRPFVFPGSPRHPRGATLGARAGAAGAFGANVDSLHILSDRPWRASRKMLRSPGRAHGLSER